MDVVLPDIISSRIYLTGEWEAVITRYVRASLRHGDVFVDVGANIGYYSVMASRLVGASGRVFAVEASRRIFQRLARNIEINGCANITAINAAASDAKGELPIFLSAEGNLGHSTTVQSLASREGMMVEERVPANTLEQLVGTMNLRRARLIKIDVEGAERSVLTPLFASLGAFSGQTEWLLELSPEFSAGGQSDVDCIFGAFTEAGYRVYAIQNDYSARSTLNPPRRANLTLLNEPPTRRLCDVLISRQQRTELTF
jgi:FkbM family methyltransferase